MGVEEIIALKRTDNGDGTFTGSMHSSLVSGFAGSDADFWASKTGVAPAWWEDNNDRMLNVRMHYRFPRFCVFQWFNEHVNNNPMCLEWQVIDFATDTSCQAYGSYNNGGVHEYFSPSASNVMYMVYEEDYGIDFLSGVQPRAAKRVQSTDVTIDHWLQATQWHDWCTFHPHGAIASIASNRTYYAPGTGATYTGVVLDPDSTGFMKYFWNEQADGYRPWTAPQDLFTVKQADGSECYVESGIRYSQSTAVYSSSEYFNSRQASGYGNRVWAPSRSTDGTGTFRFKDRSPPWWCIVNPSRASNTPA